MDAILKIEAALAACAKLELTLERTERNRDMWKQQCANQAKTLAAKEAEMVRLREALAEIADTKASEHGTTPMMLFRCIKLAQHALTQPTEQPK